MVIDGKAVAASIQSRISKTRSKKPDVVPGLGIIVVGNDDASKVYIGIKEKIARSLGYEVDIKRFKSSVSADEITQCIRLMNRNKKIHGILVQLPLPKKFDYQAIVDEISLEKDIDCLSSASMGRLLAGKPYSVPPTANAVSTLIQTVTPSLAGLNIVVVGAGFFGRQIAAHLLNQGATVSILHDKTNEISSHTKRADVIVSAVGQAGLIIGSLIQKGAIVIDVGISVVDGKVCGDVDVTSISKKAGGYTPVPGGVGPVTVACVMQNVLDAALKQA